jgi:hypothetical protein
MANHPEPSPPSWLSWLFWSAAAVLAGIFAFAAWDLLSSHSPVCNPIFPARRSAYPSSLFVFAGIAAFVLGSLTSQYEIRRQGRSQEELGQGQWSNPSAVLAINVGVASFLFLTTLLMVYEAWTLGTGRWPITYYVRCANDAGPLISLVGVVGFAFVIGRWMWVFRDADSRGGSARRGGSLEESKPA